MGATDGGPSSATILRVLEVCGADLALPEAYLLEQAGEPRFRLYEPLASAWRAEGVEIAPEAQARLAAAEGRVERCRPLLADLEAVPGLRLQKGLVLAGLYPPGWVRPSNDIDVRVPDVGTAMDVWRVLERHGFDVFVSCAAVRGPHGCDLAFGLAREGPYEFTRMGDRVEVTTFLLPGHHLLAPARHAPAGVELPRPVETALALAEEQFQRGVRARDVLDMVLLLGVLDRHERTLLRRLADDLDRGLLLDRLLVLAERTGLADLDGLAPGGPLARGLDAMLPGHWGVATGVAALPARLARVRHVARLAARPARLLALGVQQRQLDGGGALLTGAERLVRRHLDYRAAWDSGMYFFGEPIPPERAGPGLEPGTVVVERSRAALGTPAGPLALTPWTEIDDDELRLPPAAGDGPGRQGPRPEPRPGHDGQGR